MAKHDVPKSVIRKLRKLIRNLSTYELWISPYFCKLCVDSGIVDESVVIAGKDANDEFDERGGIYCIKHGLIAFSPLQDLREGVKPLHTE